MSIPKSFKIIVSQEDANLLQTFLDSFEKAYHTLPVETKRAYWEYSYPKWSKGSERQWLRTRLGGTYITLLLIWYHHYYTKKKNGEIRVKVIINNTLSFLKAAQKFIGKEIVEFSL